MKNQKKLIAYRMLGLIFFLIVQVAWFLLFFIKLANESSFICTLFMVVSLVSILYAVYKEDNTSHKIGWILIIITVPLFGEVFYLLLGNKNPYKKLADQLNCEHEKLKQELSQKKEVGEEIGKRNQRVKDLSQYIQNKSGYPVYKNTATTYYPVGEKMYEAMLSELEKAQHFIFIEFFIIEESMLWDKILTILTKKAAQGVEVRIIYDDLGCIKLLPSGYPAYLESLNSNIKCIAFNRFDSFLSLVMNGRDHRKIVVIDGHTAFSGGMNIGDEYINKKTKYGHWKDNSVMLKGEAAWNFTILFLEMWNTFRDRGEEIDKWRPKNYPTEAFQDDGYIQPFGDTPFDKQTVSKNVFGKYKYLGDLDHFFSKDSYPEFSICLYNLVPACKTCNQQKSAYETEINYPYGENDKSGIRFETDFDSSGDIQYLLGKSTKFKIKVDKKGLTDKDSNELLLFNTDKRYEQMLTNVQEIIIKTRAHNGIYRDQLEKDLDMTEDELKKMIFGYEEGHLNRIMSKFNYDIMNEFLE